MKGGGGKCGNMEKIKPILAIISLQFGYAGMYIITMVSFKHGMDHWVLATYRHIVATVVMADLWFSKLKRYAVQMDGTLVFIAPLNRASEPFPLG
ncbi:unnamed protein product [Microthlaspi erraticum]|uniref:WAT1-related protein n=1 Tax=Microthlaspi erraticum TaxID=1685480 RepID=A0A6D2JCA4_9BRAS|nr:unnamed protein product [Microthlaspi erraticum]